MNNENMETLGNSIAGTRKAYQVTIGEKTVGQDRFGCSERLLVIASSFENAILRGMNAVNSKFKGDTHEIKEVSLLGEPFEGCPDVFLY